MTGTELHTEHIQTVKWIMLHEWFKTFLWVLMLVNYKLLAAGRNVTSPSVTEYLW